jgi:solute carrier family 45 protein 1/2/4
MWSSLWIRSVDAAVVMVGAMGFSWALTLWAPFALIARCVSYINDVSRRESIASSRSMTPEIRPVDYGTTETDSRSSMDLSPPTLAIPSGISISNPDERRPSQSTPLLHPQPRLAIPSPSLLGGKPEDHRREITSAGTIMGLHNVFISSPQFLSTLLASIIFHFLNAGGRDDTPGLVDGGGSSGGWFGGSNIAIVLSVGGCGGIVAGYLTWQLDEDDVLESGNHFGDER